MNASQVTAPVLTTTGRTGIHGLRKEFWLDTNGADAMTWGHSIDAPEFIAEGATVGLHHDGSPMGAASWRDRMFRQ